VPNNLREIRVRKLMTQKDVAEGSGVSVGTINSIENNKHSNPSDRTRFRIAKFLGYAPSILFPKERHTSSTNKLKIIRMEKRMSQKELSKKSGVSEGTISLIETKSRHNPTLPTKKKLARALKKRVKSIF
jgi:transcriptional regulator with XRE-family HTH domain